MNLTTTATTRMRQLAGAVLLSIALAGCGRDVPTASFAAQAPDTTVAPATTTTTALPEPTTTTTTTTAPAPVPVAVPVPTTVPKPAPTTSTSTSTTSTTTTTIAPPPVAPGSVVSHGGPVRDHVSLVDNLRGKGLTVVPVSSVNQPFLTGNGTVLAVSGAGIAATQLQSYEYESAAAAAADAATFGPDGNPARSVVSWIGSPHLYQQERVLVVYVGDDRTMTALLTSLLGPQFSGR